MAIMQYNSGVVEDVKPTNLVFTDGEFLQYFEGHKKLRSRRLLEINNTWCLWGEDEIRDLNNFNQLGTRIVGEKIYTPLLVVHDSEINPELYITDKIINRNYKEFREEILAYFDIIAVEIIGEFNKHQSPEEGFAGTQVAPQLNIIGPTEDKRALMEFNPNQQNDDFYKFENFSIFAAKSFGYLHQFFNNNTSVLSNSFAVYADNKTIIIVMDENVDTIMEKMLNNFETREKYHGCAHIIAITKKWRDYVKGGKIPMEKKWEEYVRKPKEK